MWLQSQFEEALALLEAEKRSNQCLERRADERGLGAGDRLNLLRGVEPWNSPWLVLFSRSERRRTPAPRRAKTQFPLERLADQFLPEAACSGVSNSTIRPMFVPRFLEEFSRVLGIVRPAIENRQARFVLNRMDLICGRTLIGARSTTRGSSNARTNCCCMRFAGGVSLAGRTRRRCGIRSCASFRPTMVGIGQRK